MKRMIWTEERDREAAAMRWNGATNAQIAERFGVSTRAVSARFCYLGVSRTVGVIEGRRKAATVEESTASTEAMIQTARERQIEACERHAEEVMAQGGFCWLSEKSLGGGRYAVCLPLNYTSKEV